MYDPPLPPNLALSLHANTLRFPRQSKLDSQTISKSESKQLQGIFINNTDKHTPL